MMTTTFKEKIDKFVHVNYDHVSLKKDNLGTAMLVFSQNGCFGKAETPNELISVFGLHIVEDEEDEFASEKVFFVVDDDDPNNYEQLVFADDYWKMYSEQVKLDKVFKEVYA